MNDPALAWSYTEDYPVESEPARFARMKAAELGVPAVSQGAAATLRMLAAAVDARAVAEIGTGTGVSGAWLLEGMAPDGVLTSIDVEPEFQRVAREVFLQAGIKPARTRLIAGRALDVLPRLADSAYDMVLVDGDASEAGALTEQAWRILRQGGILVIARALGGGHVADPARRDEATVAMRELGKQVREEVDTAVLLPVGDGLLVAVR
ncbi:MAG TPA: methyltransferase domain-containing protein [Actinomycetales bacterium]|nr:methyltransferase domain-containing protein [Actinomycetales bacterium]